jgi:hypothetical protein
MEKQAFRIYAALRLAWQPSSDPSAEGGGHRMWGEP